MRIVKIITGVVGALVLIIGGLIIYLANLDLNAHKESIRAEAKAATGRDFRLDGDLDLKLSLSNSRCRGQQRGLASAGKWPRSA